MKKLLLLSLVFLIGLSNYIYAAIDEVDGMEHKENLECPLGYALNFDLKCVNSNNGKVVQPIEVKDNLPSFDCKKAQTTVEKTICRSSKLARLDKLLNWGYKDIQKVFSEKDDVLYDNQISYALKEDQRNWIASRDRCKTAQCLIDEYKHRINELEQYQVHFNSTTDTLNGVYAWSSKNAEADISIRLLYDGQGDHKKYLVYGTALYGTQNEYGPNIGEIHFITSVINNQFKWETASSGDDKYVFNAYIEGNKIIVSEDGICPFGMNVFFSGTYEKEH